MLPPLKLFDAYAMKTARHEPVQSDHLSSRRPESGGLSAPDAPMPGVSGLCLARGYLIFLRIFRPL